MIKFRGEDGMVKDCLCEECADAGDCWRLMASCPCPHDEQHECCADLAEDDIGGVMVREEDTDDVGNPCHERWVATIIGVSPLEFVAVLM